MTNPYSKYVLPWVTDKVCALGPAMKQREKVIPSARGRVLEIGVGSGLNLGYYDPDKVDHLYALDPSEEMLQKARKRSRKYLLEVEFMEAKAENIPLKDKSVDDIVITYTLCTIPEVQPALEEFRRVLRPDGRLLFCEHGLSPDPGVHKWQNRLNPVWKRLSGGCNLNRDIPAILEKGGFSIERLESMYIPGFKPACYNFWGVGRGHN